MKYKDPIYIDRDLDPEKCSDQLSSLQRVEINCVGLCNRTCPFCPRVDSKVYPNKNVHMSEKTAIAIYKSLQDIDYNGRITFSGMSEPLLHEDIFNILKHAHITVRKLSRLQIITNGDFLTAEIYNKLIDCGVDRIEINLYDGEWQVDEFDRMLKNSDTSRYVFRKHYYDETDDYGLILNNRGGAICAGADGILYKDKPCYLPFYKMVIDWDGKILLCPQDWLHKSELNLNINISTIEEIWLSPQLTEYRDMLKDNRRAKGPCDGCNVIGTITGREAFENF